MLLKRWGPASLVVLGAGVFLHLCAKYISIESTHLKNHYRVP